MTASAGVLGPNDGVLYALSPPDDVSITVDLTDASVTAQGWLEGPGWAPEDQAFLPISDLLNTALSAGACIGSWSPATSVTFTPDGGEPVAPVALSADGQNLEWDEGLAFAVPQDTSGGTLALTPNVSINDECTFLEPLTTLEVELNL